MGAVYKAWDAKLQRHVAVKRLLPPEQRTAEGAGTDLMKEASALSALQHPNVVGVYDVEKIDGQLCVVMEFLNGETLETTMRRGALTKADFVEVARQSLEGLVAAHKLGIQHRDIKPSNIMVNWLPNGDFLVKVLDFGLADFTARPHLQVKAGEDSTYGTVQFMAPEQFTRRPVDVRTDLYSLGCVLYYAATAVYPFNGNSMEAIIDAHLSPNVPPLHAKRADLPKIMCHWVHWLMQFDPEKRPENAQEALEVFKQLDAGKLFQLPIKQTQRILLPQPPTQAVPVRGPGTRTGPVVMRPPHRAQLAAGIAPARPVDKKKQKGLSSKVLVIILVTVLAVAGGLIFMLNFGGETPVATNAKAAPEAALAGSIELLAASAYLRGSTPRLEGTSNKYLASWFNVGDSVSWTMNVKQAGDYEVILDYSADKYANGTEISLSVGTSNLKVTLPSTGSWYDFKKMNAGKLILKQTGSVQFVLKPITRRGAGVMNLRSIRLNYIK